ncbi:MAG: response regulator [Chloroflexi bacterium]|nr:response regulator [Chloroflexota bacterium]MDA1129054.1 response regulator [Chloroflexota bacterium]
MDLLVEGLSEEGFDVTSATNGASALVEIYRNQPDIVLLDLMIPVVNGYQVLRELRNNPTTKKLPIILLTGVSPTEGEQAAVRSGANYYMSKPWKMGALLKVIEDALGERGTPPARSIPRHYHNSSGQVGIKSPPTWLPT